jgi:Domain of unknown function (DUF4338)/DDE_Tnp_1-associated
MLKQIEVRRVQRSEEGRFQSLLQGQHYLGAASKIGETILYVATWRQEWVALLSFSAAALKCGARDRWIGWTYRQQYARLSLLANNTRFCILDDWHRPNLASRVLALCERRLAQDWQQTFSHPLVLLETFVDPQRHRGTLYQAANWVYVGDTLGYRRRHGGYTAQPTSPKKVFMRSLHPQARALLSQAQLSTPYLPPPRKMMLSAAHMQALPEFFRAIPDPRRGQGRRHPLHVVLAIAAAAILCGARGYTHIAEWAESLSKDARRRFRCRHVNGRFEVPSYTVIRDVLMRVGPEHLDHALQGWNAQFGLKDSSLALDGKTIRRALDDEGAQPHIMSVIGHDTGICITQKK